MNNKTNTNNKKKKKENFSKVSYHYKPENMTLEAWQIALRRQAAEKELFAISAMDENQHSGYYKVFNAVSKREYTVVYRGAESQWNYCSCMDFKTSRLGTCKHLEAVKCWIKKRHKKVYDGNPSYTSVYLSYRGEKREICLRIGSDHTEEFKKLSIPYFTPDGKMRPEALYSITDFLREASQLDNTFRCYPDALSFILEEREKRRRLQIWEDKYEKNGLDSLLKTTLYSYQKEGICFAFQAGKAIIADEMGLGKTLQAIGTAELLKKENFITSALIICPTSLKYQWKKEIERFTDSTAIVIEGNHLTRKKQYTEKEFYKIVSYNSVCNDIKILRRLQTDFLIMDEVQRLKNWKTQISQAARRIEADYSVVLSGTPLENKLEELYSIMQFVDQYCLGPYYQFMDQTVVTSDSGRVIGYKNMNEVGAKMSSVLIRRRKKDVSLQLPERMDKILFVPLTEQQRGMHEEFQSSVAQLVYKWSRTHFLSEKDRKKLLLLMSQMRMVCDSTYVLDQKSRYDTKVEEVMNILRNVFENGNEKVVIFSQWERMTRIIGQELDKIGIRYEYLHGGIPSANRSMLMQNFTELPESRVFLSTDAGSTGLNLQVASILINIDLPWNPAVLEQRIARIYRIGQKRNIQIINLVASESIEERMLSTLNFKTSLFEGVLDHGEDSIFLEDSKFDKLMSTIEEVTSVDEADASEPQNKSTVQMDDLEENVEDIAESTLAENKGSKDLIETANEKQFRQTELMFEDFSLGESEKAPEAEASSKDDSKADKGGGKHKQDSPQELLQQGVSFFSGLARTLNSPEATKALVDSLVEEDKETGQTTLRIPVPGGKESVTEVFNLLGKLFAGTGDK